MNLDKKTAKQRFTISKHKDTYEIKGFSGVILRRGTFGKGSGYEYYFSDAKTPREIVIPEEIDGLPVTKVAVKCLPDDAVVFCRGEVFVKLTRATKASTARAYLEDPSRFAADEAEQIKKFLKKYSEDAAAALCGSDCVEAYVRFLSLAPVKPESIDRMLAAAEGKAEVKLALLNGRQERKPSDALSLDAPKKLTVTEFKKLWTYGEYTVQGSDERFIELRNYKGSDAHVIIPAMLGKKRIRTVCTVFPEHVTSVEFEDPDVELKCSFRQCASMADENGFLFVQVGSRVVLTDYVGPKNAETLAIPDGVTENTYGTFRNMKMRKVVFPEGFEKLAGGTFIDCDFLQSVTLPDGIKEIGQLAFSGCASLLQLYLPASLETIEFFDFKMIAEIYGEPGSTAEAYAETHGIPFHAGRIPERELSPLVIKNGTLIRYAGKSADVVVPDGVTCIDFQAFRGNPIIRTVSLPEGVTVLKSFTFHQCLYLESIVLPHSLRSIEDYAFSACRSLKTVVIPEGVRTIGSRAFGECRLLTEVKLPSGLESIDEGAFSDCPELREIHIPTTVTSIGENAFQNIFGNQETVIHAPSGSYAEQYAKEHNIPFEAE